MKLTRPAAMLLAALWMGAPASQADGWPANYGGVMLQGFYWDSYEDTQWTTLESQATELSNFFDIIWIPNAGKSSGSPSMGYLPIYWFSNYNSSFGTEDELRSMVETFKGLGLNVIGDLVLNHRSGVSGWADFPSETWQGTTYALDPVTSICRTDEWASNGGNPTGANDEGQDFDGGRDLDHTNATVQAHCKAYCDFLLDDLGYAGFRLDMVKGYSGYYTKMYNQHSKPRFSVGEYWDGYDNIAAWIESTGKESAAFDFPFKYALNDAMNGTADMTKLCWLANGTDPQPAGMIHYNYRRYSVTFIDNHDTYRNDNKFTGNVEAANAMMLCSPGTPCVFLPHWQAYKTNIKKMIAVRKAVGVTNTSTVNVLRHDSSCYMAEVTGSKGKLVVKIGSAMVSPSGYTDSQIKAKGTDWCIWADVAVEDEPGPVDSGSFKVYWDNSSASWTQPKVHYFGGTSSSTWPGEAMTKVEGTTNVYECTVASGTTGLVFNNGSGTQTDDLTAVADHLYGLSGDKGAYAGGDTGSSGSEGDDGGSSTDFVIYYDNKNSGWTTPYIHYWGGSSESTWPGTAMTRMSGNIWKFTVASGTTGVLFNAGDGDNTKTSNFTAYSGHVYYNDGDQGSILPTKIYAIGTLWGDSNKDWKPNSGVELTKSGNVYRGVVTVQSTGTGGMSFVQALSSSSNSWDACNAAHRYGAPNTSTTLQPDVAADITPYTKNCDPGSANAWKVAPGTYYVTADFNNFKITLNSLSLSLDRSTLALNIGESAPLTATASPDDIAGLVVTWESSDTGVATVSTGGTVTATGKGTATVTARFAGLEATCTVYVGKTQQSVLWSQTLPSLTVGQTLNLTATATSGLAVTYTVTNGTDCVQLSGSQLTALAPGVATISAVQAGDETYSPADAVAKTVTVILDYEEGDVNGDGSINVVDVANLVAYILGQTPAGFDSRAADLNGDSSINVADLALLIHAIMTQ